MRHHDRNRFVCLAASENLLDVIQQRLQKEAIRRNHNDKTVSSSPTLPLLTNPFSILRLQGDMNGCDVVRQDTRIAKRGQGSLINVTDWDNDPVAHIIR